MNFFSSFRHFSQQGFIDVEPEEITGVPGVPPNGYVLEDGVTNYVTEDGTTFYVQEH